MSRKKPKREASTEELSDILDVNQSTIYRWVRSGLPHDKGKGSKANRYNAPEVAAWLKNKGLSTRPGRPEEKTTTAIDKAKLRKEEALARRHEIWVEREEGKLLDAAETNAEWVRISVLMRNRLMMLGGRVATVYPDIAHELKKTIDEEAERILKEMSSFGKAAGLV